MSPEQLFPLGLSFRVAALATALVVPIGLLLAFVQSHHRYRGRALVDALILLPLVLPPTVVGYVLVVAFGQRGPFGGVLEFLGLRLVFTPLGAVIAAAVVALPLLVKTAQPALEAVPPELEAVGRSLGLSGIRLFVRVTLPASWRGVLAGVVLAYARALGEFGATLMFAGNIPGRTNTMPLELFAAYQAGDDARAVFYVLVLTAASLLVVVVASRLTPRAPAR